MTQGLQIATAHSRTPRAPGPGGRAVLSLLPRGDSVVWGRSLSVKYVLDGEERYRVGKTTHIVRPGRFLVLETSVPIEAILPRAAAGFCLSLPAGHGSGSPLCRGGIVFEAQNSALGRSLSDAASRLAARSSENDGLGDLFAETGAGLPALLREAEMAMSQLEVAKQATRQDLLQRLEAARALMARTLHRPLSVAEMADAAGMSPFHFVRRFAEAYGEPPAAQHARLRLCEAADGLLGGLSVGEAARRAGFASTGSFSRAFRARFGLSPSGLRDLPPQQIAQILRNSRQDGSPA